MELITLDFETFWSTTHSLTKMNPFEYVMHPDTELISLALKRGDEPTQVAFGEAQIRNLVNAVNWREAYAIAHNMSGFDALILSWRLGVSPALWGCTMAMARPIHAKTTGLSLAKLVAHYRPQLEAMGVAGVKDSTALVNTRGKHLADFTLSERRSMADYNANDTDQCYGLFKLLRSHYSNAELMHIDFKIRALVEPQLVIDTDMLEGALVQERAAKREALLNLASMFASQVMPVGEVEDADEDYLVERVRATLASAPMFSQLLEMRGVPVPMKSSPSNPANQVPALAKTDEAFQALIEHDDPIVAAAASARLSVKSTIAETRMQAFLDAASFTGGHWPVTTHYCGADTTGRASGWHYNPLNLPRVDPKKPKITDALRMSLMAPPGHLVVVADLSGIEMRFNHFLWNVPYSTAMWRDDPEADIYKPTGAKLMGIAVEEVTSPIRQAGKVVQLGCGFGCGPDKFIDVARIMGGLILVREQSAAYVYGWRDMHPEIVQGWKTCHTALSWIYQGIERPIDPRGLFVTCPEGIRLPSGRLIRYPHLRREVVAQYDPTTGEANGTAEEWVYGEGRHRTRIYAGKCTENIVQAGSRDVLYDIALDVFRATGRRPAFEVYDELIYVVPENKAEEHLAIVQERMRTPPSWFPDLVTWSKGDIAERYGEAKD